MGLAPGEARHHISVANTLDGWLRPPLPLGIKMMDILRRKIKKGFSEEVA